MSTPRPSPLYDLTQYEFHTHQCPHCYADYFCDGARSECKAPKPFECVDCAQMIAAEVRLECGKMYLLAEIAPQPKRTHKLRTFLICLALSAALTIIVMW